MYSNKILIHWRLTGYRTWSRPIVRTAQRRVCDFNFQRKEEKKKGYKVGYSHLCTREQNVRVGQDKTIPPAIVGLTARPRAPHFVGPPRFVLGNSLRWDKAGGARSCPVGDTLFAAGLCCSPEGCATSAEARGVGRCRARRGLAGIEHVTIVLAALRAIEHVRNRFGSRLRQSRGGNAHVHYKGARWGARVENQTKKGRSLGLAKRAVRMSEQHTQRGSPIGEVDGV